MAELVGDILDNLNRAYSEDFACESDEFNISYETDCPAMLNELVKLLLPRL